MLIIDTDGGHTFWLGLGATMTAREDSRHRSARGMAIVWQLAPTGP